MSTSEVLEDWWHWAYIGGARDLMANLACAADAEIEDRFEVYDFSEWLLAIGLVGGFELEKIVWLRQGWGVPDRAVFLKSAAPCFLLPVELIRAMQAGIQFSVTPPNIQLLVSGRDRRQEGGGLGGDHGVRGSSENVYPILRKPK